MRTRSAAPPLGGGSPGPDLVEQAVLGNDLARADEQTREQGPLSRPTKRKPASPVVDLQWSEYAELHGPPVDASTRSRGVTGALQQGWILVAASLV
jgi:hypothetical protein